MEMTVDMQKLFHFAVTVGYIRHTIAVGSGTRDFASAALFAKAHLDLPAFAGLSKEARDRAEFEIFEYSKDGLLNAAARKIAAAQTGDYEPFWRLSDQTLARKVERSDISPDLLR
jgi:hypothetical protein